MSRQPLLSYLLLVIAGTLRTEANTGSPVRQTDPRLANITSPSPERSSVPHRFRHALYAYPSMFRISEISQRGSGVVRNPHTFPYDTNCVPGGTQGAWALWAGAMRCGRTSQARSSRKFGA